jgi:hypothetical protein
MSGGLFVNMLLQETGYDIDSACIERLRRMPIGSTRSRLTF